MRARFTPRAVPWQNKSTSNVRAFAPRRIFVPFHDNFFFSLNSPSSHTQSCHVTFQSSMKISSLQIYGEEDRVARLFLLDIRKFSKINISYIYSRDV